MTYEGARRASRARVALYGGQSIKDDGRRCGKKCGRSGGRGEFVKGGCSG